MTNKLNFFSNSGQALTSLIIIMFVGMSIISSAAGIINTSLNSTSSLTEANDALSVAESGAEEAMLRIIRNPNYIGGTLPFDYGYASISIASTSPFTFTSLGVVGQHQRTIKVTINNVGGITTVSSWKEQ